MQEQQHLTKNRVSKLVLLKGERVYIILLSTTLGQIIRLKNVFKKFNIRFVIWVGEIKSSYLLTNCGLGC